ncbi:MAG TPA: alpha/beta hydrolase, partial [Actinopolymorphaceae bacterium]|nr:alpha/beta hydrolase [Actinopolymorphaceae bacterium]
RVHLGSPDVDLDTHVSDIVNSIDYADLHDVILVGHSYGGFPVTGAADVLCAPGRPARLSRLVYVDSGPLPDGVSHLDTLGPERRDATLAAMKETDDGWREPVPTWAEISADPMNSPGLDEARWQRWMSRATDQPLGANAQPLHLTNDEGRNALPHVLVSCVFPLDQVHAMVAAGHPFFTGFGGKDWTYVELPTCHWPMFSEPARLAEILDDMG